MHPLRTVAASGAIAVPQEAMTRRTVLGGMLRVGAAAVVAGGALRGVRLAGAQEAERSGGAWVATTDVNLRSGPSTGHQVLRVVPKGTIVGYLGDQRNGFLYVDYDGLAGWMSADYLAPYGGEGPGGPGGEPSMAAYTTDDVNLRESPSYSGRVIKVLPRGTQVIRHHNVSPPWGMVAVDGITGWVHGDYLSPTPPSGGNPGGNPGYAYLRVTSELNLRAAPGTGAPVLAVMRRRAKVRDLGEWSNGFRRISYKGIKGWAHADYLA